MTWPVWMDDWRVCSPFFQLFLDFCELTCTSLFWRFVSFFSLAVLKRYKRFWRTATMTSLVMGPLLSEWRSVQLAVLVSHFEKDGQFSPLFCIKFNRLYYRKRFYQWGNPDSSGHKNTALYCQKTFCLSNSNQRSIARSVWSQSSLFIFCLTPSQWAVCPRIASTLHMVWAAAAQTG